MYEGERLTVGEILEWEVEDFSLLNKADLKHALSVTRNAARKRVKRIENSVYGKSIATSNYKPENYRNMSVNQMRRELKKDIQFLTDKTSTLAGVREVHENLEQRLNDNVAKTGIELPEGEKIKVNPRDLDSFWDAYNRLREDDEVNVQVLGAGSDYLQQMLAEEFEQAGDNPDVETIMQRVKARWVGSYETTAGQYAEDDPFNPDVYSFGMTGDESFDDEVYNI